MKDAVEVSALAKLLLADAPGERPPLGLSSVKTCYGNSLQAAGMSQLLKVFHSQAHGWQLPTIHLLTLNPQMKEIMEDAAMQVNDDILLFPMKTSLVGVTSIGWGGTVGHAVCSGGIDASLKPEQMPSLPYEPLGFWPAGGGGEQLPQPEKGYHIVGSWGGWVAPAPLEREAEGVYGFTVALGANCFEDFQILFDGDVAQVLHPSQPYAPAGSAALGPDDTGAACSWRIDGRVLALAEAATPSVEEPAEEAAPPAEEVYESMAAVGDRYRVRLHIAGKWRTVCWERLLADAPSALTEGEGTRDASVEGSYSVVGSFNQWALQDMQPDASTPGLHTAEVRLLNRKGDSLQVIRNRDWQQVFCPGTPYAELGGGDVLGPYGADRNCVWWLNGEVGDVLKVEFSRQTENDRDRRTISWSKVRSQPLTPEELRALGRRRYCIVGSWDGWRQPQEMAWNGDAFVHTVRIGRGGVERFQVLTEGDWDDVLYPGAPDTPALDCHDVRNGPSDFAHGCNWLLGGAADDAGARYEVALPPPPAFGVPPRSLTCRLVA
mmetsp:Transcript_27020/g.71369  ORF Transcript_27020/g.71369 Transcript_27020/m.71369 type:complete len:548 (-) Transcript_27020:145-1788(-)